MTTPALAVVLIALALTCLIVPALADGPGVPIDFRGATIQADCILGADGRELAQVASMPERGAQLELTADGGIVFLGEMYSETLATMDLGQAVPPSGFVFETRFVLTQPPGFYTHMLVMSTRVGAGPDAPSYRIAYRFAGPCPVANNNTGFFLNNTGTAAYRELPLSVNPIAGGRYRLQYDREYIAYTLVRDDPAGVKISFYLHDTTLVGDDAVPLFEYTDAADDRLTASDTVRVQVGTWGLIAPAPPTWFGGLRVYPIADFEAARRDRVPTPALPLADLAAPQPPPATTLPNVFTDNMVIQRGKPITVWGRGIEGDDVTVSLAGETATAKVADGRWCTQLAPLPAGGPYELTVTGRDRTLRAANVMIGEVWVLGGQSNAGWYLKATTEAETEVPASDFPAVRIFSGWHPAADEAQFEVAGGSWKVFSPALDGAFSAVGYYFAKTLHQKLGVPIGILDTSTPATQIECWMSPAACDAMWGDTLYQVPGRFPPLLSDPACYYNGKVAPLLQMGVAGMFWYQGDGSSPATGLAYRRYIPALIRDWRRGFAQGNLPFFVVQIPVFEGCSAEMRASQLLGTLSEPNTGVAVTLDVGDVKDIHPRNKRPVGERLARLARQMAYGEPIEGMGPVYRELTVRDGRVVLSFDHVGGGLVLKGASGFEVRGADGVYHKAQVALTGGDAVTVWSDAVTRPVAVRYAWAPVPEWCLYNEEGLLASPFRTRED